MLLEINAFKIVWLSSILFGRRTVKDLNICYYVLSNSMINWIPTVVYAAQCYSLVGATCGKRERVKADSVRQIFHKLCIAISFTRRVFARNLLLLFHISFCWRCLIWDFNRGLTSNKPTICRTTVAIYLQTPCNLFNTACRSK